MRFVDLFAGLGGFHLGLKQLGHECVFACEVDAELRELYSRNFPQTKGNIFGDIRTNGRRVPPHDILCAGFPCQPFSKSGSQLGLEDKLDGTLFHEIIKIARRHEPAYVILENVGNFERHDRGRTWQIVKASLEELGYHVRGTDHQTSGGHGLISPHHLGFPQHRERFFAVASKRPLPKDPFPAANRDRATSFKGILQLKKDMSAQDRAETALTLQECECIDHWNELIQAVPHDTALPSFPIWGDEANARYPYHDETPHSVPLPDLRRAVLRNGHRRSASRVELLELLPAYARTETDEFPAWKVEFIRQNREWFRQIRPYLPKQWLRSLKRFPPSLRKLEWNCQGEERDLWGCVLQFRPSGLRAKRYGASPALVAMTTTQIPILGPMARRITRLEGLRLQGFPDRTEVPASRTNCFRALGNAVHVGVVKAMAKRILGRA